MVSLPQKHFVAILVGVCVLSAAIGSGLALVAQTGPAGPAGKRGPAGPRGPRGPQGESAKAELGGLEAEVEELRGAVEGSAELEERVEALEEEGGGFEGGGISRERLCEEFGVGC
ncbi:MAG TPA: hypothetical protein VF731_13075 [Solirubrobacterales bacterium]